MARFNLGGQFSLPRDEFFYDDVAVHRIHEIRYSKFAAIRATILVFTIMALFVGLLIVTRHQNSDAQIWRLRINAVVILVIFCAATIKRVPIYVRRNYDDPVIIIGPDGIQDTRVATAVIPWTNIANADRISAGKMSGCLTLHLIANDTPLAGPAVKTMTDASGIRETEVQIKADLFDRRYSDIYNIAMAFYRAHRFGWLSSPSDDDWPEYQSETAPLFRKRLLPAHPLPEAGNPMPKAKAWRLRRGHDDKL
ncbi:hypothetical protein GA0061102_101387 [Rhizobium miluonense]|uniref:Uncharacterized protein n=1 Tax=Rhizobium miluonense TaxID=411945 RepID=A0A1C3VIE8_9HYPH|nr:hypothetical protein GA0061102_101387 [Rhizobium miluonense]